MQHHLRHLIWFFFTLFPVFTTSSDSIDVITPTQYLTKDKTLVSAEEQFELGFFSTNRSNNSYIGIWYKQIEQRTIVWVANRDSPLTNSSGILKISADDGNLVLVDDAGNSVWSANHTSRITGNTVAELLDNGNFVLRRENDENPENYLWQSFNYPTDTLLPGMKLGWDSKSGINRYITSWKNGDDPSTGDFSFKLNINGFPEIYLTNKQEIDYRSGPWNGLRFSGVPEMAPKSPLLTFAFFRDPQNVYYSYDLINESIYSRLTVKHTLQRFVWIPSSQSWNLFWYAPKDQCDDYRECGVFGICDTNASPVCNCLKGFQPKNPQAWNWRDGSDGCKRVTKLDCETDGFLTLSNVKLPESGTAFVDSQINLDQCKEMCRKNCSCMGYSSANISGGGSGCVIWAEDLYDMRQYAASEGGGQVFYFRVPATYLGIYLNFYNFKLSQNSTGK